MEGKASLNFRKSFAGMIRFRYEVEGISQKTGKWFCVRG